MSDDSLSTTVAELMGLLVDDETTGQMLSRIADIAHLTVTGCDACSVALWDGTGDAEVATSDPRLRVPEQRQYDAAAGPGAEAVRSAAPVWSATPGDARWGPYGRDVTSLGYRSVLAYPLLTTREPVGSMSLYARHDGAMQGATEPVRQLAMLAAVAIANGRLYADARRLLERMEEAAPARSMIEVAKGIVLSERQCTADEAFDWLRHESQDRNEKVRDLARDIVAARTSRDL